MTIVVLDVNILVSAALNDRGLPARIADMAFSGEYDIAVSDHILGKMSEVFDRPYFLRNLSTEGRSRILRALEADTELVEPDKSVRGVAPDVEEDLVLGTAVAANADYLITGDKGLLAIGEYRGVRIVTAEAFLRELEQD